MSENTKKSGGFGKLIHWILGIALALQIFSDGALDLFPTNSTPTSAGDTESQGSWQQGITLSPNREQSQTVDRLPSVPDSLKDHIFLNQRDRGVSATLTGDVLFMVVFVDDPTSVWSTEEIEQAKSELSATFGAIIADAADYGVELNLAMDCRHASVRIAIDMDSPDPWVNSVLASAGLENLERASSTLERSYGVKEAPILFYINTSGRAFAATYGSGETEYALFCNNSDDSASQYRHELYHIFGAKDYYYPSDLRDIAQKYYPNSIMIESEHPVTDSLTAYLIGWTDSISPDDLSFLRETAYLTEEYMKEHYKEETYTGYVTNRRESNGVYTGYLESGLRQGQGKMAFDNGTIYEGSWEYGHMSGNGIYHFTDGSTYVGQFQNEKPHGQGKMIYSDGASYEGSWEDGERSGHGNLQWADGTVYTGEFQNGQLHGRGTLIYPNGQVFSGTWDKGDFIS